MKFFRYIFTAIFLLISQSHNLIASDTEANEEYISILTCTRGVDELYTAFGHTALRVRVPALKQDIVFNFGVFNFNTPNFYLKFIRGKLEYMLAIQDTDQFLSIYKREGREVIEQVLDLSADEKAEVISRLEYLYRPENRNYLYSFLYKNCTTEIRDLLFDYTNIFSQAQYDYFKEKMPVTFREQINDYITDWPRFGINLILGSTLDRKIDRFQWMFLPENFMSGLDNISERKMLIENSEPHKQSLLAKVFSPMVVVLLLILLTILAPKISTKFSNIFTKSIFGLLGTIGLILLIIICITDHTELYWNYNLLWCNPLFLALLFIPKGKCIKSVRILLIVTLVMITILGLLWAFAVQSTEPAFSMIVLMILIHLYYENRRRSSVRA